MIKVVFGQRNSWHLNSVQGQTPANQHEIDWWKKWNENEIEIEIEKVFCFEGHETPNAEQDENQGNVCQKTHYS